MTRACWLTTRDGAAWAARWAPELCGLYPLLLLGLIHQMAWLASMHLGHWPRMYVDDPGGLPWPFPWLQVIAVGLITQWPTALLVGVVAAGARLWRRRWLSGAAGLLSLVLGYWLALALADWDPGGTLDWLMD
ncbi:MAG: hypothetical protein M9894_38020 [Planctomycetes bacterium]|nr:hypothetical protein [Planctomycetota bacterium]